MTARFLVKKTYRVKAGDTVLVHAAAGGVGSFLCRWAKSLGATVIGTVGAKSKVAFARESGCDHVICTTEEPWVAAVRDITRGAGVPVVYDGVGKDTFMESLDCLTPFGLMVSFGNASGLVPPLAIRTLEQKGSLYLTRPTLLTHIAKREDLVENAEDLFDAFRRGIIAVTVGRTLPLDAAAEAHRAIESRETRAATVLLP